MADYFSFSSPEEQGLSSEKIKEYVRTLAQKGVCLHSLLIMRNNVLVAEGYEKHYNKDSLNRMYSVSKTFTSAAIGCLAGEGRLSLDAKVYEFFPEKYEGELHPYIKQATVRDLLIMATPFDETTYSLEDSDWVKSFFNTAPSHRPGRVFNYDTSATLVLCAIVEKITGMDFTVYLFEKVLKHIGFPAAPECVREPAGVQWGGSGVLCTARNLLKFAQLFMNGGKNSEGVELIPHDYVQDATKMQISNAQSNDRASFRCCGYGYQIWITENGFAFLGMGNQLAICVPSENMIVVTTADDQGNTSARGYVFDLLEELVIKNIHCNKNGNGRVLCLDELMYFPLPCSGVESTVQNEVDGVEFTLLPNKNGFEKMRFDFGKVCSLNYVRNGVSKTITFAINRYGDGVFPEIYSGKTINEPAPRGYRSTAAAVWAESDKLVLRCYLIDDYLGNFTANISFRGGRLDVNFTKKAEWFLEEFTGFLSSAD